MSTLIERLLQVHDKKNVLLSTFSGNYTAGKLEAETHKYIQMLEKHNIEGKKVGVLVPPVFSYLGIVMAVNHLGGIVVPLSWQYRSEDLKAVLNFMDPHIVFTVNHHHGFSFLTVLEEWANSNEGLVTLYTSEDGVAWGERKFGGLEKPLETDAMDFILCTSGSTGVPKGIVHTLKGMDFTIMHSFADAYEIQTSDRLFVNAPPTSPYGLDSLFTGLFAGAKIVVPEFFDIPQMLRLMKETQTNKIVTTPSIMKAVYTFAEKLAPEVVSSLELCALSGELMSEDICKQIPLPDHCKMVGLYGSSEQGAVMTCNDMRNHLEWTVYPGVEYRLGEGAEGAYELLIRSPNAFMGYYKCPELTREALTEDGLFLTGDLVRVNGNQKIEIVGRKKEMIKKGGQQVIPAEIEMVLQQHPEVKQAVVIGAPHPVYGEQIVAFVVLHREFNVKELYTFCSDRIARYKVPDVIKPVNEIPVSQGKADKMTLLNKLNQQK